MSQIDPSAAIQAPVSGTLLEERFIGLWRRCLLPASTSDAEVVWARLARHYAEPHRVYHDRRHLAECLDQLDLADDRIANPDRVEMAIWFHDIINDPHRRDNEARSADCFRSLAAGQIDAEFVDPVVDLILITTHRVQPADPDQQFICDIDLASFGFPWGCFMRDSDAVKAEFDGSEQDYYRGKTAFLTALLARPRIFMSDFFNARYEQQARDNIRRFLRDIEQQCSGATLTPKV